MHNPLTITDALGNTIINQYDSLNRLTSSSDPLEQITQFIYDDLSRLTQTTDPMDGIASQQFDNDGNRTALIDPSNNTLSFTYDLAERLTQVSSPTGSQKGRQGDRDLSVTHFRPYTCSPCYSHKLSLLLYRLLLLGFSVSYPFLLVLKMKKPVFTLYSS
jgi:YD repeat-containing protein